MSNTFSKYKDAVLQLYQDPVLLEKSKRTLTLILMWYATSLSLSFYNKWLFAPEHYNFKFPLFTTAIHTLMQFILSGTTLFLFFPQWQTKKFPKLKDYLTKVFPCGLATGLDIGLSNASLKFISLSFYTMVKSGAPVFVLLFAFLFKLEKPTARLIVAIVIIVFGVILMVVDETKFSWVGYLQVQIATVLSGLRWALTQILLEKESLGMNNPLATNLFLTPLMCISLLVASELIEGFPTILRSPYFVTTASTFKILGLIIIGGVLAFLMIMSEFRLISHTSVVTFSISGIVKEILTISLSAMFFGDQFNWLNILGLVISLIGIAYYNYIRIMMLQEALQAAQHSVRRKPTRKRIQLGLGSVSDGQRSHGSPNRASPSSAIDNEYPSLRLHSEMMDLDSDDDLYAMESQASSDDDVEEDRIGLLRAKAISSSIMGYHPYDDPLSIESSQNDLFRSGASLSTATSPTPKPT